MPQSYKTAIAFGLVYVPVTLHACIKTNDVSFNQLYKKNLERIQYKKSCEGCPANLTSSDIVKGYQYERDKYVVITEEELEKIKSKKDKSVVINEFVSLNDIDPVYFEKSYYVKPTGAENAFNLILAAIEQENKVGIAKTVLGTKEQVVAIRVHNGQMLLYTMYFFDEVQLSPVPKSDIKVSDKELALAKNIIDNMTAEFNPQNYKNEYRQKLLDAIEAKVNGREIKGEKTAKAVNIADLMDALKKSVEETEKNKPKSTKATKATKAMIASNAAKKQNGAGARAH